MYFINGTTKDRSHATIVVSPSRQKMETAKMILSDLRPDWKYEIHDGYGVWLWERLSLIGHLDPFQGTTPCWNRAV